MWRSLSLFGKNVCFCAALTGAWPYPLPHHEAARIEYYLNLLLSGGVHTRVAAESTSAHYSILVKDIAALKARGAPEARITELERLAASVLLIIEQSPR